MKVIIAGSRTNKVGTFLDMDERYWKDLLTAIEKSKFDITSVVSGRARGADRLGEWYAQEKDLPLFKFPAEWSKYGMAAGYLRNKDMADVADALIALWDGESKGTQHMINIAKEKGLQVYIHYV